jgi:predicted aspartyl protease
VAKDSVPIYHTGTKVMLDVLVGRNPVRMLLDTGAEMMQVSQDFAEKIVKERQGSWGVWQTFVMADGRKVKRQTLNIESVKIGTHTLRNVPAAVSNDGNPIMAFPVINAIGPFKIDTRNNELVFEPKVEAKE